MKLVDWRQKTGWSQGDGDLQQTERFMLRFQGIRSPNSLKLLCLTYHQTDNSLCSNNLFDDIAQKLQRKGLLIPFNRRIHSFCLLQIACLLVVTGFLNNF